jgi:hypothetical protein
VAGFSKVEKSVFSVRAALFPPGMEWEGMGEFALYSVNITAV